MQIVAAVARERAGSFSIEKLDLADPRPDELLVRIVASGMCQTDLHGRDGYYNTPLPAVFGHEGAGIVAAVGTSVTNFAVGDHVVLSFPSCSTCANCKRQMEFHCQNNFELKMRGTRPDGSTLMSQGGAPVYGAFFQQSSFATYAIANERFAVKVRKDAPLELLGPFACSGQTGAGAVLNAMQPRAGDAFAVFGVGAVGLSALMAARIAGCDPIIAVDIHEKRLVLARELGATHLINHTGRTDVVADIRKITGDGVRFSLETSAQPAVLREAIEALMPAGTCVLLGSARSGTEVSFEMPFLQFGRVVRGIIQGESHPQEFIPKLVNFLVQGKMPVDRMMTFYPLADINQAARTTSAARTAMSRRSTCSLAKRAPPSSRGGRRPMSGYDPELAIEMAKGSSPLHNIVHSSIATWGPRFVRSANGCRADEDSQTILCAGRLAIPPAQSTVP